MHGSRGGVRVTKIEEIISKAVNAGVDNNPNDSSPYNKVENDSKTT